MARAPVLCAALCTARPGGPGGEPALCQVCCPVLWLAGIVGQPRQSLCQDADGMFASDQYQPTRSNQIIHADHADRDVLASHFEHPCLQDGCKDPHPGAVMSEGVVVQCAGDVVEGVSELCQSATSRLLLPRGWPELTLVLVSPAVSCEAAAGSSCS